MKSTVFTAVIAVSFVLAPRSASGCGLGYATVPFTSSFRACESEAMNRWSAGYRIGDNTRQENLELWQSQTSADIPLEDIESIVYRSTFKQLDVDSLVVRSADNRFAEWLVSHPEDLDFLRVAKEIEEVRAFMNDPWYYPYAGDDEHLALGRLKTVCDEFEGSRLRARYAVQIARMLFTDGDYDECVSRWENNWNSLPDNILRRMICSYVGGAYLRKGDTANAVRLYAEGGDSTSLNEIYARNPDDFPSDFTDTFVRNIEFEFNNCPESQYLDVLLQFCVNRHERMRNDSHYGVSGDELKSLCLRAATSGHTVRPALWWYALSYLQFVDGDYANAARNLSRAENTPGTDFIKESIRGFRLLFDSRSASAANFYNLLSQIRWIDEKIGALTAQDINYSDWSWEDRIVTNRSVNYWQDIVLRAVVSEIAPRLVASGRTTEALQFANYAVNRITGIGLPVHSWEADDQYGPGNSQYSFDELRRSVTALNNYDYHNQFFTLCDSLPADRIAAYVTRTLNPQNSTDRFFHERTYTDPDYLCDLVGTHYLREMRYDKAVEWLCRVSPGFQARTNIAKKGYFKLDPFCLHDRYKHYIADNSDYKLRFANEMLALERTINDRRTDPDRRAMAKVRFAKGLRNSFGRCWYLTQYGLSVDFYTSETDGQWRYPTSDMRRSFANNPHAQTAYARVEALIDEALTEFTNQELAAQVNLELMNHRTVMTNYPNTAAARSIRGRCDHYHDYALHRR